MKFVYFSGLNVLTIAVSFWVLDMVGLERWSAERIGHFISMAGG